MSYKPAQSGVPNGIVYFGNAASDNVFEAESAFAYNPSTNTLNVDNATLANDLTVLGDLYVSGVVNQVALETLLVDDHEIVLNAGDTSDTYDAIITANRSTPVDIRWNEGSTKWTGTNDGSTYYDLISTQSVGAGSGLIDNGTSLNPVLDIQVDNSTIEISADTVQLKAGGIGFTHLSDALVIASGEAFSDSDTALMTAAAIADKIEDYGYSTATGTITEVVGGSGLSPSAGVTSGSVTLDVQVDDSTVGINGSDQVYVKDGGIGTTQLADGAVTEAKVTRTITEVSSNSTISNDVTLVTTGATDKTVTLPTAVEGKVVVIKKKDSGAGNVVVVGATHDSVTDTIDDASSKRLYYIYESMTCIAKTTGTASDQQAWYII